MHVCLSVGARKTPPVLLILVGVCGCLGLPSDDQLAYLLGLVKPDGVQVRWVLRRLLEKWHCQKFLSEIPQFASAVDFLMTAVREPS